MSSTVRWGILSTANIGRAFVRGVGLSKNSCLHAIASRGYDRAAEWAKEHGIPRAFGSYEEMLVSGEVDVIYNPLPNSLHAEWTIKSLEAGIPVLCEKPFTINAAEAREVVAVSERTGRHVAEAFMYRFHPVHAQTIELVRSGAIGDLLSIRSVFAFRMTDRTNIRFSAALSGGSLMDVGCYCVNASRMIVGCEPIRAYAFQRRAEVDDTLVGALEFPNGVLAHFESSMESHGRSRLEITGTTGMILLESPWFPGEDAGQITLFREGQPETITTPGANDYHLEVEDFVHAYKTHEPLRWPPEDAIANMAVLDALYKSAREGVVATVEH
jgi:D-xylose 1-dehydrogenase (NADP+, D-xylono-1,5-lactone-forming)